MNSLKTRLQQVSDVKGKHNNMKQGQMEYCEMDIEKNEFNFLMKKLRNLQADRVRTLLSHFFQGTTKVDLSSKEIFTLPNCLNL